MQKRIWSQEQISADTSNVGTKGDMGYSGDSLQDTLPLAKRQDIGGQFLSRHILLGDKTMKIGDM